MKASPKGFTLIELLVVLVVLAVGAVLVYPSFGRMAKGTELKAAAKKASSILRYYRSEAVHRGRVFQIVFDEERGEIRVRAAAAEENGEERERGAETGGSEKERYRLPEGVHLREMNFPPPQIPADFPVIEFYPNGGSNGGSFVLDRGPLRPYRIEVNFLTGAVEIKEG